MWVDPYLSRFDPKADGGALKVRGDVIERLITSGRLSGPPEVILISHGHFDHIADVPYLLGRTEWAQHVIHVLGTETHRNLLAAMRIGDVDRPVIQSAGARGSRSVEVRTRYK